MLVQRLKSFEKRSSIRVVATVGHTSWEGSLLPWADGSAQLVINKRIREAEDLELGQKLQITVHPSYRKFRGGFGASVLE